MTTPDDPGQPPPEGTPPPPPPDYSAPPQYGAPPPPGYPPAPPAYAGSDYQQPAYAGPPLATWIQRVGGFLVDFVIVLVPSVILGLVTGSRGVYDVVALVIGLAIGYMNGATGQSPGKRVAGLRLIRAQDGQLLGGGMGILRYICHFLDSLACFIGWFWPLWDDKRQTFADKILNTVVIKV
jgi:uncharacterized RDD family membrane protein YckC